jgi:hypothetical protein
MRKPLGRCALIGNVLVGSDEISVLQRTTSNLDGSAVQKIELGTLMRFRLREDSPEFRNVTLADAKGNLVRHDVLDG